MRAVATLAIGRRRLLPAAITRGARLPLQRRGPDVAQGSRLSFVRRLIGRAVRHSDAHSPDSKLVAALGCMQSNEERLARSRKCMRTPVHRSHQNLCAIGHLHAPCTAPATCLPPFEAIEAGTAGPAVARSRVDDPLAFVQEPGKVDKACGSLDAGAAVLLSCHRLSPLAKLAGGMSGVGRRDSYSMGQRVQRAPR